MDRVSFIYEPPTGAATRLDLETAPSQADQTIPHALTLRRLPNGGVYRSSHGRGLDDVRLMGTFGMAARDVGGRQRTGRELYFELKELYERYLRDINTPDGRKVRLQYHHWDEDQHYYCEITSFRQPRSSQNKLHYLYEIDLQLHTPIQRKYPETPKPRRDEALRQASALDAAVASLQGAASALASAKAEVSDKINTTILQPYRRLSAAIAAVVSQGLDFVPFTVGEVRRLLDATSDALNLLPDLTTTALVESAQALLSLRRPLLSLLARPELLKQSLQDALTPIEAPTSTGVRRVQTRANDTLPKIAARELGDPSRWTEIALLNDLTKPPYLASNPQRGQAAWGANLLIPSDDSTSQPANTGALASDQLSQERRLYGVDLRLRDVRGKLDLVLASDGTPTLVGGFDNLLQAVKLKTSIEQGQLLENPTWGLCRVVGERGELDAVKWGLREAAESDPRIERVNVLLDAVGNVANVEFEVFPSLSQQNSVTTGAT